PCSPCRMANELANSLLSVLAILLGAGGLFPRRWMRAAAIAACTVGMLFTLSAGFGGYVLAAVIVAWVWMKDTLRLTPLRRALLVSAGAGACVFFALTMISAMVPAGEGHLHLGSPAVRFFHRAARSLREGAVCTIPAAP